MTTEATTTSALREEYTFVAAIAAKGKQRSGDGWTLTLAWKLPGSKFDLVLYGKDWGPIRSLEVGDSCGVAIHKGALRQNKTGGFASDYYYDLVSISAAAPGPASTVAPARVAPNTTDVKPPATPTPRPLFSDLETDGTIRTDRKFTISYGRTINLGDFNSERIDLTMEFDTFVYDGRGEAAILSPLAAFATVKEQVRLMAIKSAEDRKQRLGASQDLAEAHSPTSPPPPTPQPTADPSSDALVGQTPSPKIMDDQQFWTAMHAAGKSPKDVLAATGGVYPADWIKDVANTWQRLHDLVLGGKPS